jgi:hypothetical protein
LRATLLLTLLLPATFLSLGLSTTVAAQPVSSSLLQQKMQLACSFLESLYNPALGLVRVTTGSSVYLIASDNLLAAEALSSCDKATSNAISQTLSSCCSAGYDGMHEALLGTKIHLPIYTPAIYTVADSSTGRLFRNVTPTAAGGNYTVLWEVHNRTTTFPDCTYADVTVYTALELKREGNTTGVQHEMECLTLMFDGRGLVDESYKDGSSAEHGIYQTFKLALYLYALQKTGSYYYAEEDSLFRTQGPDGGFHTGYDQLGTYAGTQENAETTSIAMIAISALTTTSPFQFPPFSIPSWLIFVYAGVAVTAVGIVVLILVLDQRKLKRMPKLSPSGSPYP